MNFAELEKTNVTDRVEKKGRFNYLSWPFAVSEFRKACPNGKWTIVRFDHLPYQKTDMGAFVSVIVWPDVGEEKIYFEQVHPVLNNQNKPIADPNPFDINTSIQRCLVKAIAIATGIGLYIYAGEDLPPSEVETNEYVDGDNLVAMKAIVDEVVDDLPAFLRVAEAQSMETIPRRNYKKLTGLLNRKIDMMRQPGEEDS